MLDQDARPESRDNDSTSIQRFNGAHLSTRVMPAGRAAYGGDWCEAFRLSQDVVALSIGDVCGHGVDKFATMSLIRQVVRDAAYSGLPPDAVLNVANSFVCTLDPECPSTAVFALLDVKLGTLTFANAGHPPPLMVNAAGPKFFNYESSDLALGIEPVLAPVLRAETLPPSALLVFYTDGVTERDRDPIRGEDELRAAAHVAWKVGAPSAASIIEELLCLSASNPDDAAILTVSIPRISYRHGPQRRPRFRPNPFLLASSHQKRTR